MDISFIEGNEKFNYRVCAVIINGGRILAMRDERSPYFYLPGGRVRMRETAEEAVLRETAEELGINARIARPLWLSQSFFREDVDGLLYHELCVYFLMDVSGTELEKRGGRFRLFRGGAYPRLRMARVRKAGGRILLSPVLEEGDIPPARAFHDKDGYRVKSFSFLRALPFFRPGAAPSVRKIYFIIK